jgi:hypothetical protein
MKDYKQIIDSMPIGLKKAVARQLYFHQGAGRIIGREELLQQVQLAPGCSSAEDRQMRIAIQQLRNQGFRICHREERARDAQNGRVRVNFGYYLAKDDLEYQEFRAKYASYAQTIWRTLKAMDMRAPVLDEDGSTLPMDEVAVQEALF